MIRLALIFSLLFIGCAHAESLRDSVSNVAVVGEAEEDVAPDRAILRFGVVTERPTASAAASENAAVITAILDDLKQAGIADADMQTQGVSLQPISNDERDAKGKVKTIQSYRASNTLAIYVKPVEKAGDIVGRVIDKGANSLDGVDYDHSNLEAKRDELRARAVKDAERRARIYAEAAGLRLARVIEIRPAGVEPVLMKNFDTRMAAAPAMASVPLRPGQQRISERVAIIWALAR